MPKNARSKVETEGNIEEVRSDVILKPADAFKSCWTRKGFSLETTEWNNNTIEAKNSFTSCFLKFLNLTVLSPSRK